MGWTREIIENDENRRQEQSDLGRRCPAPSDAHVKAVLARAENATAPPTSATTIEAGLMPRLPGLLN